MNDDRLPLALFANAHRIDYARVLRMAIRGDLPAERIRGRWYVTPGVEADAAAHSITREDQLPPAA